jgi:small subunit ribosomal protein S20
MRQTITRTEHNRAERSAIKTAVKKARSETTAESVANAIQVLDRGARKGQIHRNTAARKKSRLVKKLASSK